MDVGVDVKLCAKNVTKSSDTGVEGMGVEGTGVVDGFKSLDNKAASSAGSVSRYEASSKSKPRLVVAFRRPRDKESAEDTAGAGAGEDEGEGEGAGDDMPAGQRENEAA